MLLHLTLMVMPCLGHVTKHVDKLVRLCSMPYSHGECELSGMFALTHHDACFPGAHAGHVAQPICVAFLG